MDKERIVILGAGGFAEEAFELVSCLANAYVEAFIEGIDRNRCAGQLRGRPIMWIGDVGSLDGEVRGACAVGTTRRKDFIHAARSQGLEFATLVHPSAVVSPSAVIGKGSIIGAGVVIGAQTQIGCHTIVNRGALLGHHLQIGDYVTIGPGTNIGAYTSFADQSFVGIGATILDRIKVGTRAAVGAGSLVTKDVADCALVVGVPAETFREIPEGL